MRKNGEEKEALIAVIVPVYNAEQYLSTCVKSIMQQTYKNLEIILIDDGSTDSSYYICTQMLELDSRIKVLHKENGGPISAKKLGLESTDAEYIMFVDADDWIKPQMCERLIMTIQEHDVDLVTSGIIRYFENDTCLYEYDNFEQGKYVGRYYRECIISHMLCDGVFPRRGIDASLAIKLFKREILYPVIKMASENYRYLFAEDTAVLYPYLLRAESIFVMKECFYYHRQYENKQKKYYEAPNFDHEVEDLYSYLKSVFEKSEASTILMKQLDYFVCGLFWERNELHAKPLVQEVPKVQQYLFPFHRVKPDSKILLYGAGTVGKSFYAQLVKTRYCASVLWQDKQYERYRNERIPVDGVCVGVDIDACVIAVQDGELASQIKQELVDQGMEERKIVWEPPLLHMW